MGKRRKRSQRKKRGKGVMAHLLKAQNLMMKNLVHPVKEKILVMKGEMTAGREEETEEDLEAERRGGIKEKEIVVRKIEGEGKGEILVKRKKDQERGETPAEITDVRGRLRQGMKGDHGAEKEEIRGKDPEVMIGREKTIEEIDDKVIELFNVL